MIDTISSLWQSTTHYFFVGVSLALLLLFVCSCLCIAAWVVNWPIFIVSGVPWGGLAISMAFAWSCVTYYQPFLTWALPQAMGLQNGLPKSASTSLPDARAKPPSKPSLVTLPAAAEKPKSFSTQLASALKESSADDPQSKEAQLDALVNKLSKP